MRDSKGREVTSGYEDCSRMLRRAEKGVGSLFTILSAYRAAAALIRASIASPYERPNLHCQTGAHAAHYNVTPPIHSPSQSGSLVQPTVAAVAPASRSETSPASDLSASNATDSTTERRARTGAYTVTHEKLVKVSTRHTSFVGAGLRSSTRITPWFTRVQFGLNRPIGQSLIRALRHIIKFDSGLLIKSSDLRVNPGP
jgi:hypothetical protein